MLGTELNPDRVVVISDQSSPTGGAERMALLSAEVMAAAGIPVIFIAGDRAQACPLDRSNIEVIALGETALKEESYHLGAMRGLYNAQARKLIEQVIADHDTPGTVYHLHNWTKLLSPSIFAALAPVASRLFMSAHDYSLVCPNLAYSNYQDGGRPCPLTPLSSACIATNCDQRSYAHKLWRVVRTVERRVYLDLGRAKPLIGIIHPEMVEYFTRGGVPAEQIRVIRNPVSPYSTTRVAAEDNQDIFFIGRVVYEKGVDLAAEAARRCGRRLRVIGDGDARAALERTHPEVTFEGWRSHAEIAELITAARALVVPSRLPETFTLVAHEALRSGVPVVTFADVDCREAAELGAALVVPPRKVSDLTAALRVLDDDQTVAAMSRTAFAESWRFSNTADTWRDALLAAYGELLGARAGRASTQNAGSPEPAPA